ncbi:GspE/PulE family protein [Methylotenera sp.]|uniref:GspE/PulE family protein n=1 Tax=Methylotenera sp. TaxID=2051956 RepID=UPI0024895BE7|nr:GspE/PulE family protein [Methylotenera sp.]MDI1298988.1 GspE/PulE family protein [Methylotenera sp.]
MIELKKTSIIDIEQIKQARSQANIQQRRVIEILEDVTQYNQEDFLQALSQTLHFDAISMKELHSLTAAFEVIPFSKAQQKECLAFISNEDAPNNGLILVFADPFNEGLQEWALENIKQGFTWRLAHRNDIAAFLARHEETMRAMDSLHGEDNHTVADADEAVANLSLKSINEDSNPIIKLINSTLYDALKIGASDIHLECSSSGLSIKYRIDGVMNGVGGLQGMDNADQAISRVKVMAQLDIAERRTPQDGRFKVIVQGRDVDFRVSIMPSVFGEDAVLRVLDRKALSEEAQGLSLHVLGFDEKIITQFRRLALEPYGMVLVTGPTGSGKTTSLYAAISEVNTGHDKIITIEDPVEYQLPGVLQIPVNEKKGLTFAKGLRSILRHDPDKIMVGEIRDSETAQIAVQAALTGHLVFTTVHANNVLDVIGRFMHMGVDPYNFVSAMNGIMAQRLIRSICPHCAEDYQPDDQLLADSGISQEMAVGMKFKEAKGCGHCRGTGYRGRKAVAELLILNDELREMIVAREPIRKLKEAAKRSGMRTIREAALEAVGNGLTTLQEINRVTFVG